VDEANRLLATPGVKEHGLAFAQAREQKSARGFLIGWFLIELAVRVEQWRDQANLGRVCLQDFQTSGYTAHGDKEPCARQSVNDFLGCLLGAFPVSEANLGQLQLLLTLL
jgi:hypothetical protein